MNKKVIIFIVLIILVIAIFLSVLIAPPKEAIIVPLREDRIPDDAIKVTPEGDLFPPILHSDEYETPIPLPGPINTAGGEDSAFITPDGNSFYFFFVPDVHIPPEKQVLDSTVGIWVSHKVEGKWSKPERVLLNDDLSLDGCQFVQGNTMWFCSVREGNLREIDFYTAEFKDGKWTNWENVGELLNVVYGIGELHLTADGNELYFHSSREGGKGENDIWVSEKINGQWQEPQNVEAVNSEKSEGWPYITQDGNELWFTRWYQGTPAIFRSQKINGEWQEPELIISQFAGESTLDSKGNIYFTHHFYKDGQMIEADIYVAYRK